MSSADQLLDAQAAAERELAQETTLSDEELTRGTPAQRIKRAGELRSEQNLKRLYELSGRSYRVREAVLLSEWCPAEILDQVIEEFVERCEMFDYVDFELTTLGVAAAGNTNLSASALQKLLRALDDSHIRMGGRSKRIGNLGPVAVVALACQPNVSDRIERLRRLPRHLTPHLYLGLAPQVEAAQRCGLGEPERGRVVQALLVGWESREVIEAYRQCAGKLPSGHHQDKGLRALGLARDRYGVREAKRVFDLLQRAAELD